MIKSNQTVWSFIQQVAMMVNEIVSSNMFNDNFWISILNWSMNYIYWYHKWSWNIYYEEVDVINYEAEVTYPIQEIIEVIDDLWNLYIQWEYKPDTGVFVKKWNKLYFNNDFVGNKITVAYRRWFIPYTVNDMSSTLDIPAQLEWPLASLMQFRITPIWLWEWSWGMMNNYLQIAINELNQFRQIDTYEEAQRPLNPKRR